MLSKQQCSQFHNNILIDYDICLIRVYHNGRMEGLRKIIGKAFAMETDVPYSTCQHTVCQYPKTCPYHIQHLQVLQLQDYAHHLEFTTLMCEQYDAD
jgi:hypothetical protein